MHIVNIHRRIFDLSQEQMGDLIHSLATPNDEIWPNEKWPKMKLDNGLSPGSKGGHGPIKYYVESIIPNTQVVFRFTGPKGFEGIHKFDIKHIQENKTELIHTLDMEANGNAYFLWFFGIKWLHNALIEDGLDKIHNKVTGELKVTKWNYWVRILRNVLN